MSAINDTTTGQPVADDSSSLLAPPSHELRLVSTSTTAISVASVRELKPKRERDWREAFSPSVDEELVETHGCALAREILIHGRIYVSATRVYFKSNILGYKTLLDFPLNSVVAIGPRMTALVIPNSLELVCQGGDVYQFCTLNDRDGTLDILLALWRVQAPEAFAAFAGRKSAEEAIELRARATSVSSVLSKPSSVGGLSAPGIEGVLRPAEPDGVQRSTQAAAALPALPPSTTAVDRQDEKTPLTTPGMKKAGDSAKIDKSADLPLVDQLLRDSSALALATLAGLLLLTNAYLLFT